MLATSRLPVFGSAPDIALAAVLATVGIYSVSAYLAAQRSRETGMRMALGADFGHVAALTYRSVLIPSAFGLAIRLGAAAGLTRLLKTLLFRVSAGDPITLTFAGLTLVMISVLAATSPAIRATLSDPARILRRE